MRRVYFFVAMVHEVDSACEATQLHDDFQYQFRAGKRPWVLLPEFLKVAAIRPIRQYETSSALDHSCYPVYKMLVILLAQLAKVLRFNFESTMCGQALMIAPGEVLELFDRHAAGTSALCTINQQWSTFRSLRLTCSEVLAWS